MKKDFAKLLDKFHEQQEKALPEFEKIIQGHIDDEKWLLDHIFEKHPNALDVEDLFCKVPPNLTSFDAIELDSFVFFHARLLKALDKSLGKISHDAAAKVRNIQASHLLVIANEMAFFTEISGCVREKGDDFPDWLLDMPVYLRRTKEFERYILRLVEQGKHPVGVDLDELKADCLDFLNYCHEVYGFSESALIRTEECFDQMIHIEKISNSGIENKTDFNLYAGDDHLSFSCSEKTFFIVYFSKLLEVLYGTSLSDSSRLMAILFDTVFLEDDPMSKSDDIMDRIKKRYRREFGSKPLQGKSSAIHKIRKLADYRVKRLLSIS